MKNLIAIILLGCALSLSGMAPAATKNTWPRKAASVQADADKLVVDSRANEADDDALDERDPGFCGSGGRGRLGDIKCAGQDVDALKATQAKLLDRAYKVLARPAAGNGTHFVRAAASLRKSQAAWLEYVAADCAVGDDTFGSGNANAQEGLECEKNHYAQRNQQLVHRLELIDPKG